MFRQPNLVFPALISPAHALHAYLSVRAAIAVFQALFLTLGVLGLHKLFVQLRPDSDRRTIAWLLVLAHLGPFTNGVFAFR